MLVIILAMADATGKKVITDDIVTIQVKVPEGKR